MPKARYPVSYYACNSQTRYTPPIKEAKHCYDYRKENE